MFAGESLLRAKAKDVHNKINFTLKPERNTVSIYLQVLFFASASNRYHLKTSARKWSVK